MRIDWGKMLLYLLGLIVAQRIVWYVLALLGLSGITLVLVFEFIISFLFTYLYYPSYNRRYALKDPDFKIQSMAEAKSYYYTLDK